MYISYVINMLQILSLLKFQIIKHSSLIFKYLFSRLTVNVYLFMPTDIRYMLDILYMCDIYKKICIYVIVYICVCVCACTLKDK